MGIGDQKLTGLITDRNDLQLQPSVPVYGILGAADQWAQR